MKRVLLIDDSVTIHRVIDICLDKEKFTTEKTFSADDAVVKLKANPADIVLLDNKLEGINLPEFTAKIRSLAPSSWIILLTGAFDTFSSANLQASGADDYIFKPFDSNAIEQKLLQGIEQAAMPRIPSVPVEIANERDTEIIMPETEETEEQAEIIDLRAEVPADETEAFELTDDEEQLPDEAVTEEEKEELKHLFDEEEAVADPESENLDNLIKELYGKETEETKEEVPGDMLELKSITEGTDSETEITDLMPASEIDIEELTKIIADEPLDESYLKPLEGEISYDIDDTLSEAIEEVPLDAEFEDLTQISAEELAFSDETELPDTEIKIVRSDDEPSEELSSIDDIDFSSLTAVSAEDLIEELSAIEKQDEAIAEPAQEISADTGEFNFAELTEISLDEFSKEVRAEEKTTEVPQKEEVIEEIIDAEIVIEEEGEEAPEIENKDEVIIEEEPLAVEEITETEESAIELIEPETKTEEIREEEPAQTDITDITEETAEPVPIVIPAPAAEIAPLASFNRDEIKAAVTAAIDSDMLKDIIREVLAEKIEAAVKDSLPAIAERIITEEIERLKRGE